MLDDPMPPNTPPPVWLQYVLLVALAAAVAWLIGTGVALLWR